MNRNAALGVIAGIGGIFGVEPVSSKRRSNNARAISELQISAQEKTRCNYVYFNIKETI